MIGGFLKLWDLAVEFFQSRIGKAAAAGFVAALVFWAIHHHGYRTGIKAKEAEYAKAIAAAELKATETKKASDVITGNVRGELASANAQIAALSIKLKTEVPRYVSHEADRRCVVSAGYVQLRNAAGSGSAPVPPAAGQSVDADSGLVLSDLAENDIKNAAAFYSAVAEITAWREWYSRQADLWEKNYGAEKH